jgi:transcriptional regulator with XRE-family HTH domain
MQQLKELRERKGFTQKQLAKMVGVTQGYLSKLESGEERSGRASFALISKIAKVLDVPANQVLSWNLTNEEIIKVIGQAAAGAWVKNPFWIESRQYTIGSVSDDRFPGVERFGLEVNATDSDRKSVAVLVPIEHLPGPLDIGRQYLVQRRNDIGESELTIRQLRPIKDESLWLFCVGDEDASPRDREAIPYFEHSPVVTILARVSSWTHFV